MYQLSSSATWPFKYDGKLCFDFGYNTEDILMTIKTAVNWKDCYKNILYTFFDYQNWLGPKAMWIDLCDFHSDEDLLLYSYYPWGLNKDTGDKTFLWQNYPSGTNDYEGNTGTAGTPLTRRRPTASQNYFYRDCFVLDYRYFAELTPKTYSQINWSFILSLGTYLLEGFHPDLFNYILSKI